MHNANGRGIHNAMNHMAYTMHDGLKPKWIGPSHVQISGHNTKIKAPKGKACMHNVLANQVGQRAQLSRVLKE